MVSCTCTLYQHCTCTSVWVTYSSTRDISILYTLHHWYTIGTRDISISCTCTCTISCTCTLCTVYMYMILIYLVWVSFAKVSRTCMSLAHLIRWVHHWYTRYILSFHSYIGCARLIHVRETRSYHTYERLSQNEFCMNESHSYIGCARLILSRE